jgi:hypothetical protein
MNHPFAAAELPREVACSSDSQSDLGGSAGIVAAAILVVGLLTKGDPVLDLAGEPEALAEPIERLRAPVLRYRRGIEFPRRVEVSAPERVVCGSQRLNGPLSRHTHIISSPAVRTDGAGRIQA